MIREPRRVAVFTGTRAEYGLLYWLLRDIQDHPCLDLQLMVGGMHLSPEFGRTVDRIIADGFSIAESSESLLSGDSPQAIARSMALGLIGAADALARRCPDLLVLLGDRFEILPWAQAAMLHRIPIAHLHGGEATEGLIDEAIRHAVTKMSHLHFVAAEPFRRRVIQLGEHPDRVFTVGALGLDHLRRESLIGRAELEESIGISLGESAIAVTFHPVTLQSKSPLDALDALLAAIDRFPESQVVITYPNADTGGRVIISRIREYADARPDRVRAVDSLGSRRYLSLLQAAAVVVGNSSSGLIEAPSLGTPTVNVGDRQRGRLRAPSVIDCAEDELEIVDAVQQALSPRFRELASRRVNPYGDGGSAPRILERLVETELGGIVFKSFHDMEECR